jgi:SAM-dependent methyltransferase
VNVQDIAPNLKLGEGGIWCSKRNASVSYPAHGNDACFEIEEHSFWFQHRNRSIASIVRGFPPAGALFDLGGGNGFVSLELQQAGWQSVVVEPGRAGAVNARKRGLANVICATFEDAGFRAHSMPAAGLFDVLEHIADDGHFLRLLREKLIPGGRIYLTVPAYPWLWSAEDVSAGHFRRYTRASLASVLRQSGFEVEFASYIFSPLPLPILISRTIPSLLGRRRAENVDQGIREHHSGSKLADGIFAWELRRLERKKTIPCGGSCLVVARSKGSPLSPGECIL